MSKLLTPTDTLLVHYKHCCKLILLRKSLPKLLLLPLLYLFSCGQTNTTTDQDGNSMTATNDTTDHTQVEDAAAAVVYPWLAPLNLRDTPSQSGRIITTLTLGSPLHTSGKRSETHETITLRGTAYTADWLEVTTPDGKTGWVFSATVMPDDYAARQRYRETAFFWNFEPENWTQTLQRSSEAGDATSEETVYTQAGQILQVLDVQVGEYGYQQTYRLYNDKYELQQVRYLELQTMTDAGQPELSESWLQLQGNQARKGIRVAKGEAYRQIGARPSDPFSWQDLDNSTVDSLRKTAFILESFAFEDMPAELRSEDVGCSCQFYAMDDEQEAHYLFFTDMGERATIKINGDQLSLKNLLPAMQAKLADEYWLVLREHGQHTLFGDPIDTDTDGWEYGFQEKLIDALLIADEVPEALPRRMEGTVGMGTVGHFRDLYAQALASAKRQGENSEAYLPRLRYGNEEYKIIFSGAVIGRGDGDAEEYEGFLGIWTAGDQHLEGFGVKGYCGC